jgi:hypothetical protein
MASIFDFLPPSAASQQQQSAQPTLFDLLRRSAMAQQANYGGATADASQAQYAPQDAPQAIQQPVAQPAPQIAQPNQPSPLDTAQWPAGPVGAPSQAMAQMPAAAQPHQESAQQAQPQPSPTSGGGFFGNLMTGIQALKGGGGISDAINGFATGERSDPAGRAIQAQNLTAQALIQKGVDPQIAMTALKNPDLMKTLITQTFGPQTVQSLGSGYVADKNGKITRAFEPDDKTPTSALEYNFYKKGLPEGETPVPYQTWLRTKDADPNKPYVLGRGGEIVQNGPDGKPVVLHKNQDGAGDEASIDDKTATLLAGRVLQGDTKALVGLGRGAQGAANILKIHKLASDLADKNGIDAKGVLDNVARQAGLVSSARALGTKETHFGVAEKAMEESLPLAQAASDAVPRSNWIGLNKLVQMGQTQHADPTLKRFLIATDTAAKDYARTINPTGALRESDIEYARKILSTSDGPEAYKQALDQLHMEAGVMHRAISRQKDELLPKQGGAATVAPKIDDLLKKYGGS